jgi:hypothetical protein
MSPTIVGNNTVADAVAHPTRQEDTIIQVGDAVRDFISVASTLLPLTTMGEEGGGGA